MSNKELFNYIVPIFNKEDVLSDTLKGIDRCSSKQSKIYTVIDGCTDGSEKVVDTFIAQTGRNITKIRMPNVHMLRSVNAALTRVEGGFSVIMQDDIILKEPDFEDKICQIYEKMGDRLGVLSMRLGANLKLAPIDSRLAMRTLKPMIKEVDFIKSPDDSQEYPEAEYQSFYPRIGAINGPNVIPWKVRKKIGVFDETLAPYGYDDPEYCLRAMKAGFINGIYPLRYYTEEEWGGTRRSKSFLKEARRIHRRNRIYIWNNHKDYIKWLWKTGRVNNSVQPIISLRDIPDSQES